MDTTDLIHKLISLATNNPNEAEASAAALKAVQLIKENGIKVGVAAPIKGPRKAWTQAEQADFAETLQALMNQPNPDDFIPEVTYPSFDIDDGFMKQRITEAWRKIRRYRQVVETEYRRLKMQPPDWRL